MTTSHELFAQLEAYYKSPGVPQGFDTILGWLVSNQPQKLRNAPADMFSRVGYELTEKCFKESLPLARVRLPKALDHLTDHASYIHAYPVELLEAYFSDSTPTNSKPTK